MRQIKEILRLVIENNISINQAAASARVSRSTAQEYVRRAIAANITTDDLKKLSDTELEEVVYKKPENTKNRIEPDWQYIHKELKKKNTNLQLLWFEYKELEKDGIGYSFFCEQYNKFKKNLKISMRQKHIAGEKLFVDYAGSTIEIANPETQEKTKAYLFVATLGASNYMYAEATSSLNSENWINAHVNALNFFGGVPKILVPDNTKTAVKDPNFYDPEINVTYNQMAKYYDLVVLPARPRKPKDKAKVEKSVQVCQIWLLGALRNRVFFSLAELNQAIKELLVKANNKPFKKMDGSRASWFETMDKPELRELPSIPYEYAQWQKAIVQPDYHVAIESNYYSVPYKLIGKVIEVRITQNIIECFYRNERIASHIRNLNKYQLITINEHRPKAHSVYCNTSKEEIISKAEMLGSSCVKLFEQIFTAKDHHLFAFRTTLGILNQLTSMAKKDLKQLVTVPYV